MIQRGRLQRSLLLARGCQLQRDLRAAAKASASKLHRVVGSQRRQNAEGSSEPGSRIFVSISPSFKIFDDASSTSCMYIT